MPESPLQGWQNWTIDFQAEPRLIRRLGGGRTNRSYLIEVNGEKHVLRRNTAGRQLAGIDRQREKTLLEQAAQAGLAPALLYCSPAEGVLITEFIDGHHWQPKALQDPLKLARLQALLERVHQLPVSTAAFDYQQHAGHYWTIIEQQHLHVDAELYDLRQAVQASLQEQRIQARICHHDPHPENVIEHAGRLYLIDWEYAAAGWPAFDYAALTIEWDVASEGIRLPAALGAEEFEAAKQLYRYLCRLWTCVQNLEHAQP